jgi:hypothetical protein
MAASSGIGITSMASSYPSSKPAPDVSVEQPAQAEDTATLMALLAQDRQWLLRQLDSGRWSQWRLDLAALERELGQMLDLANERFPQG